MKRYVETEVKGKMVKCGCYHDDKGYIHMCAPHLKESDEVSARWAADRARLLPELEKMEEYHQENKVRLAAGKEPLPPLPGWRLNHVEKREKASKNLTDMMD